MNPKLRSLLMKILAATLIGGVLGALGGWIVAQRLHVPQVDQLASFRPASTTEVFAANGEPVASYAVERRIELSSEQIPHVQCCCSEGLHFGRVWASSFETEIRPGADL